MQRESGQLGLLQTLELRIQKDPFILNSAVSEYAKTWYWQEAVHMLWQLGRRANQVACNAVIGACTRWQFASQLLQRAFAMEVLKPDVITYTSVLKACKRSLAWQNAMQQFQNAGRNLVEIDTILLSAAVGSMSESPKTQHWSHALKILWWPPGFSHPARPESFASSLSIQTLKKQRAWQQASLVLSRHCLQRLVPKTMSLNAVLGAFGDAHLWQSGLLLMKQAMVLSFDVAVYNTLVGRIVGHRTWTIAQHLLQGLRMNRAEANVVTYNAVMGACDKQELWWKAHFLLLHMASMHLQPDMFSLNTALGSCQWRTARFLLSDLPLRRLKGDVTSFSRCIISCEAWPHALDILGEFTRDLHSQSGAKVTFNRNMRKGHLTGLTGETVVASAAANVCGRASQLVKAAQLLRGEEVRGSADVMLFNTVMSAFGSTGRWQNVQKMLRRLQISQLQSDTISCNAAISSCDKGQRWQQGFVLFEEVRRQSIQYTSVTYNAAISASRQGEWRASLWLVEEMQQNLQASSVTYNTAIAACVPGSMWERAAAYRLSHSFHALGIRADAVSYSSAITSCSDSNKWKFAWLLLEDIWEEQVSINHVIAGGTSSLGKDPTYILEARSLWRETSIMLELLSRRQAEANVLALGCVVMACEKGDGHKHLLQGLHAIDNYAWKGLQVGKIGVGSTELCVRQSSLRSQGDPRSNWLTIFPSLAYAYKPNQLHVPNPW